jgi:endonuclease YncB( thermonuclease family)
MCARLLARIPVAALVIAAGVAAASPAPVAHAAGALESYAIVRPDATLVLRNRVIRLFGIFVPDDGRLCGRILRPARCGNRAAVALDFKIQRFVRCIPQAFNDDGSITAVCTTNHGRFSDGDDLGAYLIGEGLALADPDAPFAYRALERIAAARGRGVWGFPVDRVIVR